MKTTDFEQKAIEEQSVINIWESFVSYLESIYFEGAVELLDKELICFEYNDFIDNFV